MSPTALGVVASGAQVSGGGALVAGYRVYHDSTNAGSITSSGGVVSQWNDLSGNGWHLTASGTEKPATGVDTIGGLNALTFDGTDDRMFWVSNPLAGATAGTMYIVSKNTVANTSANAAPVCGLGTNGDDWYSFSDGTVYNGFGSSARHTTNTPSDLRIANVSTFIAAASDWRWYRDGASQFSTATNTIAWGSNAIVGFGTGASSHYSGKIAAIVLYPSAHGTTDQQTNEAFLKAKFSTP